MINIRSLALQTLPKKNRGICFPGYIPSLNKTIGNGEIFGTVEAVKTVSDLYMPVSGTVIEINPKVEKSPELVNQDPYGSWIIKIRLSWSID